MRIDEKTLNDITKALKYLRRLPEKTYFQFNYSGHLQFEADTQEDVRTIRSAFPGVVWKKKFQDWNNSWQYSGKTRSGLQIVIAGCTEGPPACKMVEEVVLEEREVPLEPVKYEKRMVEVKKVRYICPDGDRVRD